MGVEYRENPAGIRAMLAAPWMVEALRRKGEAIKAVAEANTPVDTGRMKASWRVRAAVKDGRAWVRVLNTARSPEGYPYPAALEFVTRRIKKRRILGRAVEQVLRKPAP